MKNLKIEWLKIRSYRTFWVLTVLFVLCLTGLNYIVYQIKAANNMKQVTLMIGNPFSFPDVWQTVTYVSGFLLFLPGLILLILVTNEYNFKTHRQNIIDGMSRFDFATSKILMAVIASVIVTVLSAIVAVTIGSISGSTGFTTDKTVYLLYFLLQAFTYSIVGLLLGFLFKRSGLAIALYFIYLFFIKNIISALLDHYFSNTGEYIPVKSADALIPFPVFQNITTRMFTAPSVAVLLISTLVYLAAFYYIIIKKFTTEDL